MVDDFIDRKHGRAQVSYPHPDFQYPGLKPVLEPTYGVILYQEQVMQIAQVMAGYSLGGADLLRRAMGKKKPEEMAKQKSLFPGGLRTERHRHQSWQRTSSTWWKSLPAMVSTSPTPRPMRWFPTRPCG